MQFRMGKTKKGLPELTDSPFVKIYHGVSIVSSPQLRDFLNYGRLEVETSHLLLAECKDWLSKFLEQVPIKRFCAILLYEHIHHLTFKHEMLRYNLSS